MALTTGTALALGGLGLAGAIAGSQKDKVTQSTNSLSGIALNDQELPTTGSERGYLNNMSGDWGMLRTLIDKGPGASDVGNALDSQRSLAAMFGQYSQTGGLPGQGDISTSNDLASKLFQAQHLGLQQSFDDQRVQFGRQAAIMGRAPTDPILQAKMAQEQTRQEGMLNANQGAWATQFSLNLPMQRLQFAQGQTEILSQLGQQAVANRSALLSTGTNLLNNERNWRLQGSNKFGQSNSQQESGGGLKGGINGFFAGVGGGLGVMNAMNGGGMGGAGASPVGQGTYFGGENPYGQMGQMGAPNPWYQPAPQIGQPGLMGRQGGGGYGGVNGLGGQTLTY